MPSMVANIFYLAFANGVIKKKCIFEYSIQNTFLVFSWDVLGADGQLETNLSNGFFSFRFPVCKMPSVNICRV